VKFLQIIEFRTSDIDAVNRVIDEFVTKTEGKRTSTRATITEDRDQPGTYLNVVEFPSYETAMENSKLPETNEVAAKLAELCDGPPIFRNLNIVREENL
jgi:quinol monooxygenase YgiN